MARYFIPEELAPEVARWAAHLRATGSPRARAREEAEAAVFGVHCREEGPYADRAETIERTAVRFRFAHWRPLCGHCGRLAHEGTCLAGEGTLDVSTPTAAPAVDERDQPAPNSPADVLGPLHGRAA